MCQKLTNLTNLTNPQNGHLLVNFKAHFGQLGQDQNGEVDHSKPLKTKRVADLVKLVNFWEGIYAFLFFLTFFRSTAFCKKSEKLTNLT